MKINFRLPGKLRLPYRVTRKVTASLFHWMVDRAYRLDQRGFWHAVTEKEGHPTSVYRMSRSIPGGDICVLIEVCDSVNTAMISVKVSTLGLAVEFQVEDWQEVGAGMDSGWYGSYVEVQRSK